MKQFKLLLITILTLTLFGCTGYYDYGLNPDQPNYTNERYEEITDNPFIRTEDRAVSTFSTDVDTASYSNIRRFLSYGTLPDKDAVRIEEMLNYFTYELPEPAGDEMIHIQTEYAQAPWHQTNQLVMIGLKTQAIEFDTSAPMNLVFLIDVSGSMNSMDKLPLVKQGLILLINHLRPIDKLSIVTYAGSTRVVYEGGDSTDKTELLRAIDQLQAGGSTAGASGIDLAYKVAKRQFIADGNNRIILASDGDFNVGISDVDALKNMISEKRDEGIFLSVLGFGSGNLRDDVMSTLAQNGNGVYYYIDSMKEAEKVFLTQLGGTMITVAKDVKLQVEFNPAIVKAYRLIGYENRLLENDDFEDDNKDAADLGSGHVVIACYEIVPVGSSEVIEPLTFDPIETLKYTGENHLDEVMTVSMRYKHPELNTSQLKETVVLVNAYTLNPSRDFRFATAVIEFGLILRDSPYKNNASFDAIIERAKACLGFDPHEYRSEFVRLVEMAKNITHRD